MDSCGVKHTEVSKATLGRIPVYIKYLRGLSPSCKSVSATSVARELGLGEVQVRKDLAALCGGGRPRTGYVRGELLHSLEEYLARGKGEAIIVGAGKLGTALLDYSGFADYGCEVLAAFDCKLKEPEVLPSGKTVYPMDYLGNFCREHEVGIGIIAVPAPSAQSVFDTLYANGVRNIWCFAPTRLYKPSDAFVQYENLALSLAHLKSQIV